LACKKRASRNNPQDFSVSAGKHRSDVAGAGQPRRSTVGIWIELNRDRSGRKADTRLVAMRELPIDFGVGVPSQVLRGSRLAYVFCIKCTKRGVDPCELLLELCELTFDACLASP
jgi:hypothetical protein